MEAVNAVVTRLEERFAALADRANIAGARRVFIDVPLESLMEILTFCRDELAFDHLCTVTGLDNGEQFEFLYHIAHEDGIVLTLKVKTPRDGGVLPSVMPIYNGAIFYELELQGLLGVTVDGLPADRQYPPAGQLAQGAVPHAQGLAADRRGAAGKPLRRRWHGKDDGTPSARSTLRWKSRRALTSCWTASASPRRLSRWAITTAAWRRPARREPTYRISICWNASAASARTRTPPAMCRRWRASRAWRFPGGPCTCER